MFSAKRSFSCISTNSNVARALKKQNPKKTTKYDKAFKGRPDVTRFLHVRPEQPIAAPSTQPATSTSSSPILTSILLKCKRAATVSDISDTGAPLLERAKVRRKFYWREFTKNQQNRHKLFLKMSKLYEDIMTKLQKQTLYLSAHVHFATQMRYKRGTPSQIFQWIAKWRSTRQNVVKMMNRTKKFIHTYKLYMFI